jgi:hypothetical protein
MNSSEHDPDNVQAKTSKPIGGFFDIELGEGQENYHPRALALNSGRACLNLIVQRIAPKTVYVPFYCCDSVIEPLLTQQIPFHFYPINSHLQPLLPQSLGNEEYAIVINYFGIQTPLINTLVEQYKEQVIVDNTQAFFDRGNGKAWSFNSARKFFGVPDGAYLYCPEQKSQILADVFERNEKFSYFHLLSRLVGKNTEAYQQFLDNERLVDSVPKAISVLSQKLLSTVRYDDVVQQRRSNFDVYHQVLASYNRLTNAIDDYLQREKQNIVPFFYPLLPFNRVDKTLLFEQQIFIPTFWNDTISRFDGLQEEHERQRFAFERELAERVLPLPIDQRYTAADCHIVMEVILPLLSLSSQ